MKKLKLFIVTMLSVALVGCSAPDISKDDNSKVAENTTMVEEDDRDDSKTEEVPNNEVVAVISAKNSWAIDVTNPSAVMENSSYFLKVRVVEKEKTKYFVKNVIMPSSTYNLEVLEVLQNDDGTVPKNIKLAVSGGVVSQQDYVNTMDEESKKKAKVDKLSKKELKENVLIHDESYYELKQGQEYNIFVCDLTDDENYKGYYGMLEGGYDVFEEKDGKFINVLTGRTLEIK